MQVHPPTPHPPDPKQSGYWLVHRKLQPWQPAVWQILFWRMWREEKWACRCLIPDTHTDRQTQTVGISVSVYTAGDRNEWKMITNRRLYLFSHFVWSVTQDQYAATYLSEKKPAARATRCSSSLVLSVCFCLCWCLHFAMKLWKGWSWGAGLKPGVMFDYVFTCAWWKPPPTVCNWFPGEKDL